MWINVKFKTTAGDINLSDIYIADDVRITAYEISADGKPLIVMPLAWHDDSQRLHTICRRRTPEIDELEV